MKTIKLYQIAHARSGDKGPNSNAGVVFYTQAGYELGKQHLTPDRVKAHMQSIVAGEVKLYELPNLKALNFILGDSLGGGGSESLQNDAQGKTHGQAMLLMELDVPDDFPADDVGV
ncbi:MAG: hypothetical protein K9N22_08330 [Candidatus Marinimicrobia bacterium]|nr:hypothetical protein [Candidatus Neomarinimicrobiota bacterium]